MTTTTATLNLGEVAEFWRVARRLYSVYIELDRTFELDLPPCTELEHAVDRPETDARERVLQWFDQVDARVQVWQLRQLLQSTNLQNEENLRYLIARHLEKAQKNEADKDKSDFLLVQLRDSVDAYLAVTKEKKKPLKKSLAKTRLRVRRAS